MAPSEAHTSALTWQMPSEMMISSCHSSAALADAARLPSVSVIMSI